MENNQKPKSTLKQKMLNKGDIGRIVWSSLKLLTVIILAGGFMVAGVAAGFVAAIVKDEPLRSPAEIKQKINENDLTGFAYFADGSLIGQLSADEDRRLVELEEISKYVKEGFIATEDKLFESHYGINVKAIGRATIQELTNSPIQTGGSTITQQLLKLTILSPEVSKARKFKEILLALRVERILSKEQILQAYLNEIYFGVSVNNDQVYGIQAAAKGIFGVNANELNIPQSAFLIGIPNNPNQFNPFISDKTFKKGKERQEWVLQNMLEDGVITQKEHDDAVLYDIKANLAKPTVRAYQKHHFLMYEIEHRATEIYLEQQGIDLSILEGDEYTQQFDQAKRELQRKGYKIYTTIDPNINETMNNVALNYDKYLETQKYKLKDNDGNDVEIDNMEDIGAVLMDNRTGAILGMVGGRDPQNSKKNKATRMKRQPGSTMKPVLAYGPAIEERILQPATVIDDAPLLLKNNGANYYPLNWNNKFQGMITAREALVQSYNIPAIKTYLNVGPEVGLGYLKEMGVTSIVESDYNAQTAPIGGLAGITVEEMTNTYLTLANKGTFVDGFLIDRIVSNEGDEFYKHETKSTSVFSEQTAWLVTDMLRDVVKRGTGSYIGRNIKGWDLAGKTGTTNEDWDAWFIGYSPSITLGIWNGFEYPVTLSGRYEGKRYDGRNHSKEIWTSIMQQLIESRPELSPKEATFEQPSGIIKKTVCAKSGMLPTDLCKEQGLVSDWFNKADIPTDLDNRHMEGRMVTFDGKMYIAKDTTPDDMVTTKVGVQRPEPYTIPEPEDRRDLPEERWKPLDWEIELPAETDPRESTATKPNAPANVTSVTSDTGPQISWAANSETTIVGYRIYRGNSLGQNFERITSIRLEEATSYIDVTGGPSFSYYVTAVEVGGLESDPSTMIMASETIPDPHDGDGEDDVGGLASIPSRPNGLNVTSELVGASITWNANSSSDRVIEYRIYYSSAEDGPFQLIGNTEDSSWTHISFQGEGWYYVTAVNEAGESKGSRIEHAKSAGD